MTSVTICSHITPLANGWQLVADPQNVGRREGWFRSISKGAVPVPVPGVIQQVFPELNGVFWYYHTFTRNTNLKKQERALLRFEAVDYLADVWLNGKPVGSHEGGETPFDLDVTKALKQGANLVAVRVLNPCNQRIIT